MSTPLQTVVTRHWNQRAPSYVRNHKPLFSNPAVSRRWAGVVAGFVGRDEQLTILDAGCGPGTVTRTLVELGHKVTAVDVSTEMLDLARGFVESENGEIEFLNADAADLPLPDNHFDLIISRYVVWTLPDPAKAIREWHRVLKPGGRMGIIDGNWYLHTTRNGPSRLWLNMLGLMYKIRSGFDKSQKLATHYAGELPTTYARRPDWDVGLLTGLGFSDIKIRHDVNSVVNGLSWQRLNNIRAKPFLVEGKKPLQ